MDERILDLHLNRLPAEQIPQVEQALADSPELATRSRALHDLLTRLDSYEADPAPDDLAESVMSRIEEQARIIPMRQPESVVPAGSAQEISGTPVLSLRELIAIAACITLFVGIFVPGYRKAQNIASRNLCRDHLWRIWQGMDAYSRDNKGYLAHVGYVPDGSWLATRTPNVPRYSNTRPWFRVLQGGYIRNNDPRMFNCPAMPDGRPMIAEDYSEFDDFAESANVSFSTLLMNSPQPRKRDRMDVRMVLAADASPLFDHRAGRHQISPYEDVNSMTHENGAGQNAVFIDGRGGWFARPTIGVNRDNIYRAGQLVYYRGTETPISPTDAFVVP